ESLARLEATGANGTTLRLDPECADPNRRSARHQRVLRSYFLSRKNLFPGPASTVTELFATPPTGLQAGFVRLSASSRLKPVASTGHEMVNWFPDRLADNDGGAANAIE